MPEFSCAAKRQLFAEQSGSVLRDSRTDFTAEATLKRFPGETNRACSGRSPLRREPFAGRALGMEVFFFISD